MPPSATPSAIRHKSSTICPFFLLTFYFLLSPLLFASTPPATNNNKTSDVRSILDQHIQANGGRSNLAAINTLTQRGYIEGNEGNRRIIIARKRPNRIRINISDSNLRLVIGYDGNTVWHYYEQGAQRVSRDEQNAQFTIIKRDSPFWLPILEPENPLYRYTLLSNTEINGRDQFHIEVTIAGLPGTECYYIDTETFLLTRRVVTEPEDNPAVTTTDYSDYQRVSGVLFPHRLDTSSANGMATMIIERIQTNTGLFDNYFTRPDNLP